MGVRHYRLQPAGPRGAGPEHSPPVPRAMPWISLNRGGAGLLRPHRRLRPPGVHSRRIPQLGPLASTDLENARQFFNLRYWALSSRQICKRQHPCGRLDCLHLWNRRPAAPHLLGLGCKHHKRDGGTHPCLDRRTATRPGIAEKHPRACAPCIAGAQWDDPLPLCVYTLRRIDRTKESRPCVAVRS